MRIAFIGNVEFSKRALQRLLAMDCEVVGVLTRRSSPSNSDHVDLSGIARAADIPFAFQDDLEPQRTVEWLESLRPEVVFCFGWSRLLPERILRIPPKGVVGFHPAPLPRGRGRHPIVWALALGLDETASTFFLMDAGADTGPILSQETVRIRPEDDAGTLYDRICQIAMEQIGVLVPSLERGGIRPVQQDPASGSCWRKRGRRDGRIDWRMPGRSIVDLVRALARPYPGAHFETREGREVKVWKARVMGTVVDPFTEPGRILAVSGDSRWFDVRCADSVVRIESSVGEFTAEPGDWLP